MNYKSFQDNVCTHFCTLMFIKSSMHHHKSLLFILLSYYKVLKVKFISFLNCYLHLKFRRQNGQERYWGLQWASTLSAPISRSWSRINLKTDNNWSWLVTLYLGNSLKYLHRQTPEIFAQNTLCHEDKRIQTVVKIPEIFIGCWISFWTLSTNTLPVPCYHSSDNLDNMKIAPITLLLWPNYCTDLLPCFVIFQLYKLLIVNTGKSWHWMSHNNYGEIVLSMPGFQKIFLLHTGEMIK